MSIEEYIGSRIKELLQTYKISKYRLAQLTGISQTAIGNIITGKSIPTIPTLERICGALGITLAQFFTMGGNRPDLTSDQIEILTIWDGLSKDERRILMRFARSLVDK